MNRPCCDLHDVETPCGHVDICCDECPTFGDASYTQLLLAALGGVLLLVLFALALP